MRRTLLVRRSDEGFAQRRRWTFYEVVILKLLNIKDIPDDCQTFFLV